jgi:hypothetical protein
MGILNLGLDIAISVLVSEIRLVFPLSENSSGGGASKWSKRPRGEIKVKYVGKRRETTGYSRGWNLADLLRKPLIYWGIH